LFTISFCLSKKPPSFKIFALKRFKMRLGLQTPAQLATAITPTKVEVLSIVVSVDHFHFSIPFLTIHIEYQNKIIECKVKRN
jgi:hypothetical protein